jgi:hypothetical protein
MYFNNYIQIALYGPVILVLLALIAFTPKTVFFKSFKVYFSLYVLLSCIALVKGFLIGVSLGKDGQYIKEDFLKITTFVFFIGLPYLIIGINPRQLRLPFRLFNYLGLVYTVLVSLSLYIAGNTNEEGSVSIYPGNLFGATTMNLTIISAWTFYAFALYRVTKKKLFLVWTAICYTDVLWSLAKWNIIAFVGFPVMLILVFYANNQLTPRKRKKYTIAALSLVVLFFANIGIVMNPIAKLQDYESVDEYLARRVFGDANIDANIGSNISVSGDQGIKDGARLAMWGDLLTRTGENPIAGVGLGTRALDYIGLNIEDHNVFVTHVSRYGIPLFIGWLVLNFLLIRKLRTYILADKYARFFKFTFTIMYLNFFFQASVGNIWGQVLVALLIGMSVGLLLYKNKEIHATLVNE